MAREQSKNVLHSETNLNRRVLFFLLVTSGISPALPSSGKTKSKNPFDEKRLLEQNKRIQKENNAPEEFPNFVREGLYFLTISSQFLYVICNPIRIFALHFREVCEVNFCSPLCDPIQVLT